jgi:glycosyltransferase involved in cell wall biosynthesis
MSSAYPSAPPSPIPPSRPTSLARRVPTPVPPDRRPKPLPLFPQLSPVVTDVLFLDFAAPSASLTSSWNTDDVAVLCQQRLAGVALRLLSEKRIKIPAAAETALRAASFAATAFSLQVISKSIPALEALEHHGIPFAISKGPGVARYSHGPVERPFTDLDVLVPPEHFRRGRQVLSNLGYREDTSSRPPWGWFDRYCREAVNLKSPLGGSIDLHHHIPPLLWTRQVQLPTLIGESRPCPVGDHTLPLLPAAQNLLIVALHVVSDHNSPGHTLMIWRDLLTLAPACDPVEVLGLARRHDLVGWLRWVIGEIPAQARPPQLWEALQQCHGRPRHQVRLTHLLPPHLGSRHMIGQVFRLPLPQASCYIAAMVLPSPRFLRQQVPDAPHPYRAWWRRSLQRIIVSQRDTQTDIGPSIRDLVTTERTPTSGNMSVLMVAPGALFLSAISYYSAAVARALQRHGTDIRVLLIRRLCPRFLYPGRRHVGQYGLAVLRLGSIPAHEELDWFSIPSLWTATRRLRDQRPEVLLLQWWTSAMAHNYLLLARSAKQLGCSVVLELHELRDVGEHGIPLASTYTHLMMSRLAKYCDGVIVHSHADVQAVSTQYPSLGRLPSTVIFHGPQEHGADTAAPSTEVAASRGRRVTSGSTTPVRFLYFGVIRPYKGLADLVTAFEILVSEGLSVHLTVAGEPWTDSEEPLAQLRSLDPTHYTTYLDYLPDDKVNALFRESNVLVAPYRRVSASGPISMAMAEGIPIVTTRLPSLIEACDGYGGIEWAEVGDSTGLAAAMRRSIGRIGGTYHNPHDWDTNADRYLNFFARVRPRIQAKSA